jgi:hypothetical protein
MNRFEVYIRVRSGFKLLDTVFFNPACTIQYVRDSLIEHDGYPYNIIVKSA